MDRKRAYICSERIGDRGAPKIEGKWEISILGCARYRRTIQPLADVTNASVTRPITGSPSIYEVLAVLRRAMGRQAREGRGGIEGKRKRGKKRKRRRGGRRNVLSLTLHRFPLVALRPAKNLGQHDSRGSKDEEMEPQVAFLAIGHSPTEMRSSPRPVLSLPPTDHPLHYTYRRGARVTRANRRTASCN